jgi:hypothetical protein
MNENETFIEALSIGFVIPRTQQFSAKVKELSDAGLIKAEQIEDCESGQLIWVCNGLSDQTKNAIYQRKAKKANEHLQAQLRATMAPFLPGELKSEFEKAISEIKLF